VVKTHTFVGRRYRIIVGEVDGNTDTDRHLWMVIGRNLREKVGLETAIHEALHACDWRQSEQKVMETARDISRFLWRLGYRCSGEH
jgi:hypothetical protein